MWFVSVSNSIRGRHITKKFAGKLGTEGKIANCIDVYSSQQQRELPPNSQHIHLLIYIIFKCIFVAVQCCLYLVKDSTPHSCIKFLIDLTTKSLAINSIYTRFKQQKYICAVPSTSSSALHAGYVAVTTLAHLTTPQRGSHVRSCFRVVFCIDVAE